MPIFIPLICLIAMGLALFRRSVPLSRTARRWAMTYPHGCCGGRPALLSAQRAEWGQAMLGELDHIDGWGRRWRFAAGVMLRQPGVAIPGLLGGLLVALAWLVPYGVHRRGAPVVGGADAGVRGAAAGGSGGHALGRQRRRRAAHRPAGRVQRQPGPVPVRGPSPSR